MRRSQLLISAIQFLIIAIILWVGVSLIILSYQFPTQLEWIAFLVEHQSFIFSLGLGCLVCGLVLSMILYWAHRSFYLRLQMDPIIDVKTDLLKTLLENYWVNLFPKKNLKIDVVIHRGQKIEFIAEIPQLESKQLKKTTRQIEKDVGKLLQSHLQYKKPFFFTLTTRY